MSDDFVFLMDGSGQQYIDTMSAVQSSPFFLRNFDKPMKTIADAGLGMIRLDANYS